MTGERAPGWLDPDDDRTARAAWSRLVEPGDAAAGRLVAELGAGPALLALVERTEQVIVRLPATRRGDTSSAVGWRIRLPQLDPIRDLGTLHRFGGELLVPTDPQWPTGLHQLGERAPFALWVRGSIDLAQAAGRSVAVVGCRACSRYGEWVAAELSSGSADRGVTVVSGAAYGIDAAAHRGALGAGGRTVAVLACGVDRWYPRGNDQLIERIAREGLVVSEVPPGSSPTRWRFVQRNRVIAAMATATVVVEAAWRSGASITAREAADLGRPVGAVPGPVSAATSAGCHRLLRDGAVCVTDAAEVVELVSGIGQPAPAPPPVAAAIHDDLDPVDLRVFDALPLRQGAPLGSVARTAGLDVATVTAAVGRLEVRGLAQGGRDRWRRTPVPPSARARGVGPR
jgi:DNA processing protein